ncbi:MAG: hypothetical protein IKO51_10045 [Clostridia bacterium]|nr:hypothetical protein [Clostridia bacterium]
MKKLLSALLVLCLMLACIPALADGELPFELKAPVNTAVQWLEGGDSPTTMCYAYSMTDDMAAFFQAKAEAEDLGEFFSAYPFADIWLTIQIDWAMDDVNDPVSGWHYNEYWNGEHGFGYDEEYNLRTSEWDGVDIGLGAPNTVNEVWIMRGVPNDARWNGDPEIGTPGVKDQLNAGQYVYDEEAEELHVDFGEHTAYFRSRFVVTVRDDANEDSYYYSDWTAPVAYGKEAENTVTDWHAISAPEISGLHMTDETFNDNPVVAFTLTVPEELAKMTTEAAAKGGAVTVETYARVKGDADWALMGNSDRDVRPGELKCALITLAKEGEVIPKDTEIELRCRYRVSGVEDEDIYSDYSKTITFGSDEIGTDPIPGGVTEPVDPAPQKTKCKVCGICPFQPLGICLFIWLAIILAVVIVVIIIASKAKKKKK